MNVIVKVVIKFEMTFCFEHMESELSDMLLMSLPNIDVLKSRSRLLHTILDGYDNTTENPLINIDWHVRQFYKELPHFSISNLINMNKDFIRQLGNRETTISDFVYCYSFDALIVMINYYQCSVLEIQLILLVKDDYDILFSTIDHSKWTELMINSKSIRDFNDKL